MLDTETCQTAVTPLIRSDGTRTQWHKNDTYNHNNCFNKQIQFKIIKKSKRKEEEKKKGNCYIETMNFVNEIEIGEFCKEDWEKLMIGKESSTLGRWVNSEEIERVDRWKEGKKKEKSVLEFSNWRRSYVDTLVCFYIMLTQK